MRKKKKKAVQNSKRKVQKTGSIGGADVTPEGLWRDGKMKKI